MNKLQGTIYQIQSQDSLSLVKVTVDELNLTAIVIDTPQTADYLKVGQVVQVMFKETEVVIGKGDTQAISLQNQLPGQVAAIEKGSLLCKLKVSTKVGEITSIITTRAVEQLALELGSAVVAMIKTNEMMLSV